MKFSIVHKLSFLSVLLVLISTSIIGFLFYSETTDVLVKHALEDISRDINESGDFLRDTINNQRDDVLFLANTPPIQGILRTKSGKIFDIAGKSSYQQWRKRLQNIFKSQLERKKSYISIRFISDYGKELVHVQRKNSQISYIDDKNLQNKAHRKYFSNTLSLASGAVYLSEINLNREFNKIIFPHQQVLRTATPVYNEITGELSGVVAITAEIGSKLKNIQRKINQNTNSNIYITNEQGGYLVHPDPAKSYGFDLGKHYRIQEDIPYLSKLFIPGNKDTQITILPHNKKDKRVISFTKIPFDIEHPERFISVTMTEDYDSILKEQSKVLNNMMLWAVLLSVVAMILGVFFSIGLTRPIKQVTAHVDDVAQGKESSISLPTYRTDEVGTLARSFESMIDNVKKSQNELNNININLENIVSERTQRLEKSEHHQRLILESIADAIILVDENGLIMSFNQAAENIFGYTSDEVINKNIAVLLQDKIDQQYITDSMLANTSYAINRVQDLEGQRKNGNTFPIELSVAPLKDKDRPGIVAIIRDITERKNIEKMKNEFVSTVSHELRTPLTSIRGSLSLINSGVLGNLPEKISDMLNIATNNTERLILLINDILDIQKIESGIINFHFEKLNVTELVEHSINENKAYGEQYNVNYLLKSNIDNAYIRADKNRFLQVMANLLSNAAKFSKKDSSVDIAISKTNAKTIRISITDYGAGIPEKFLPHLFAKFTQSDSSDTRQKGGTGLGLSVTKMIVENMHGKIGVESTEAEGSTFWIEFELLSNE